jgi:hypothetical protein
LIDATTSDFMVRGHSFGGKVAFIALVQDNATEVKQQSKPGCLAVRGGRGHCAVEFRRTRVENSHQQIL